MRSERLLAILFALQGRGLVTSGQLAERLDVSERTIHRDMDALTLAGVPVHSERGRHGGWRLLPGYRAEVGALDEREARALFAFAGKGGSRGGPELRSALGKLLAALPAAARQGAAIAQDRVVVDDRRWLRSADESPWRAALEEATFAGRRVSVAYRAAGAAEAAQRVLEPLGLVLNAGTWYLVAQAPGGKPRIFRVSRVESAEVLPESFSRPPRLDLERLWRELRGRVEDRGQGVGVRLRVRAQQAALVGRVIASQLTSEPATAAPAGGWVEMSASFVAEGAAAAALAGFGAAVEVLEPPSVRARLEALGRELAETYSGSASTSRARATRPTSSPVR